MNKNFWNGKRVFITGHTGFKGSWLSIWLVKLGAKVKGYALEPPTNPSLFEISGIKNHIDSQISDIRDFDTLKKSIIQFEPEIIFHLAAQPLVRDSYKYPIETYDINVMGTVKLLEAIKSVNSIKVLVNITTDKCYENKEWVWGYRENEPLGGYDPYSSSKACSELVTSSYRASFFNPVDYGKKHNLGLATARAGNVIGGGDWAKDRLVPDCMRSFFSNTKIIIRNPNSIRPWQYVLEPLSGYLLLAEKLYYSGDKYSEAWNFGPDDKDAKNVEWIVNYLIKLWDFKEGYEIDKNYNPHEANYLKLDCSKAKTILGWNPKWNIEIALQKTVEWYKSYKSNKNMLDVCFSQIDDYEK